MASHVCPWGSLAPPHAGARAMASMVHWGLPQCPVALRRGMFTEWVGKLDAGTLEQLKQTPGVSELISLADVGGTQGQRAAHAAKQLKETTVAYQQAGARKFALEGKTARLKLQLKETVEALNSTNQETGRLSQRQTKLQHEYENILKGGGQPPARGPLARCQGPRVATHSTRWTR